MIKILTLFAICLTAGLAGAQEEEPGHMHGPDGRHVVAPQQSGGSQKFILSHHDMRIEGPDGKIILGCTVDSTIHRKGDPKAVIHTERNAYEPENEVYGSHMTYREPGEYVLSQTVKFPDGRTANVLFPVYVPAVAGADMPGDAHAHGPNYVLIVGVGVGAVLLLWGAYRLGRSSVRSGGGAMLAVAVLASGMLARLANAQEEEGHLHGPDGRHIVAPDAAKASGPMLRAYPAPGQGDSAEQSVDGVKYVLSIENEEMSPDPDLVAIGSEQAKLIGLATARAQVSTAGSGLQTTGRVSANPNGLVQVNARASGVVVSLGALPGTMVRRGQVLAVIESPDLAEVQAAYQRARAQLAQAEAAVKIGQSGVDSARTRVSAAESHLLRQRQLAQAGDFASPPMEAARATASKFEAAAKSAQISVSALESTVSKLERGVDSGVVAKRELDDAKAKLASEQAILADAKHQLELAREAYAREQAIASKGLRTAREVESSQADLDLARSAMRASTNALAQARADLSHAKSALRIAEDQVRLLGGAPGGGNRISIPAPISGEVENRTVSLGQTVSTGEQLYDLLNADIVWILCDIYEKDLRQVQVGQSVEVVASALPDRVYKGEVAFVHNEVDEKTRTTKVRVVVDNSGEMLKQNMFVRVQLGTGGSKQTLVPTAAIQTSGGQTIVFVEEIPGTYRRTVVQVAGTLGGKSIIKSGLEPGSKIVTDGAYQLLAMAGAR